ncbi:CehA/McbA family metallohydrolase [Parvularcula dongshanensis]|uniref:TolB protein n=1 Tax=Parvularcula dongshanensis TaxID=1173995 RepID=A0A840I7B9_9PROT|nr:CehA/McbA family metallohydrolase [Parvularcula dongshanensis]MBB4660161.1 TolB protein [Parvularcula dongshanensis]
MKFVLAASTALALLSANAAHAQWTNHYPKVEGFRHQVYLEQEDLPILASGPIDPAPAPDGERLAFAHQGWIWVLDLESGTATRVTDGPGMDARPRWSPDGTKIAFVRDSGSDTAVIVRTLDGGEETIIDTPAIELDPEFSEDGAYLYYTSAQPGPLNLWRRHLETGTQEPVTRDGRVQRGARTIAGGGLVYVDHEGSSRTIRYRNALDAVDTVLNEQGWTPQMAPDTHPDARAVVYGVADGNANRLAVMDIDRPTLSRWLTSADERALMPAWSADGERIYYVVANEDEQFALHVVPSAGGDPAPVEITEWDYGTATGTLTIETKSGDGEAVPARLVVRGEDGHPIASPEGQTFADVQYGGAYFYTDGETTLTLPQGRYVVTAMHGPFSVPTEETIRVRGNREAEETLTIEEIWDAEAAGYASADHHIHLNASGAADLDLTDLLPLMAGEDLDQAAPMAWNQYNRFVDKGRIGQTETGEVGQTAVLSQEVRSDFHGHVGLIGAPTDYNPWFFGPYTPTYGTADRTNADAVRFGLEHGALPTYVHPVAGDADPFDDLAANGMPYELVLDGVLSEGVGIELVCMWTSPLGTAEAWYRFLNIGKPMPATAGTDMMSNFYRTPAIGTTRAYVRAEAGASFDEVLDAVRRGESFLTTGPALLFSVEGTEPGGTTEAGQRSWTLDLTSVQPVETVEIVVNGEVAQTLEGLTERGSRGYEGTVDLPKGGWVAARAYGGEPALPSMAVTRFAHSSPIWIGEVGSRDPAAAEAAAQDLLKALDYSKAKFDDAYGETETPKLDARFEEARAVLEEIAPPNQAAETAAP